MAARPHSCAFLETRDTGRAVLSGLRRRVPTPTQPAAAAPLAGALADLRRRKPELLAEHALLLQQLLVLRRGVKRPASASPTG